MSSKGVDLSQKLLHTYFLRLDGLHRRREVDEILQDFTVLRHLIDCHVSFCWQLNRVVLVDVDDHEDRVRRILLENLVDLDIVLFNSHTGSVPTNNFFVNVYLEHIFSISLPFCTYCIVSHYICDPSTICLNPSGPPQMESRSNLIHQSHPNTSVHQEEHPRP